MELRNKTKFLFSDEITSESSSPKYPNNGIMSQNSEKCEGSLLIITNNGTSFSLN